jgi:hypothetical protein
MAMNPRDFPLDREQVSAWLTEYAKLKKPQDLKTFLQGKVAALKLPTEMVNTTAHDNLENQTPVVEMILMDLPSYGYSP